MLVAAEKNKFRTKKLYEDEVTSTVFGPIADMEPAMAWNVVHKMLLAAGLEESIPPFFAPSKHQVKFWPRNMKVEPDVIFHFNGSDGDIIHIILEVKWGEYGSLSPNCELIRQWLTRDKKDDKWFHLYLVDSEIKGNNEVEKSIGILAKGCESRECQCDKQKFIRPPKALSVATHWGKHLRAVGWRHLQKVVQQTNAGSPRSTSFSRWAIGVQSFLKHSGYAPFVGFNWLAEKNYQILDDYIDSQLFIKTPWFAFLGEEIMNLLDTDCSNNLFKKENRI